MNTEKDLQYIRMAINLGYKGVANTEGGPFGSVIVKNDQVIGTGNNQVTSLHDPTAHAEVVAIREACRHLQSHQLAGCTVYTSCEPCPMCLGAIYWARPDRIVYACTREDAAAINFDDEFIYSEIHVKPSERKIPAHSCGREEGLKLFESWKNKVDKI